MAWRGGQGSSDCWLAANTYCYCSAAGSCWQRPSRNPFTDQSCQGDRWPRGPALLARDPITDNLGINLHGMGLRAP